ncbi:MAG: amino acid ABC transporter permease [Candidatus Nanopelagicales bacterium]|jgi:His/Glu/Gln/Arg/opine family amino acid ABC transporter permease subunit|nr:amino acid ABC transporter permease [Actinomycetota bacterium]
MTPFSARSVNYDWGLVWDNRDMFWWGLVTALQVSAVALVLSMVFGMLLALGRMGRRPGSILAAAYINIFRGIPALVSVIWVYFGWSLLVGYNFSTFQAGVIALTLLYSAFFAEIFRSALTALSLGQNEAGLALGMSSGRVFFSVKLPQATKIAIPNIGNMFIGMVKDTSVFTVIGLVEIVRVTQNLNATYFQPFVLFTTAAIIYVVLAFVLDFMFRTLEKTLSTPTNGFFATLLTSRRSTRINKLIEVHGDS